jgi:phage tail sheath protein FI
VPEYLAPGVYVEEINFSAPTIEGVSTTTTGFAGPTLTGPVAGTPYGGLASPNQAPGPPQLLTSFGDFQNIYGGYDDLAMALNTPNPAKDVNYMAMAVQAFFTNGGSELYVSRVCAGGAYASSGTASATNVVVAARFPGAFLNGLSVAVKLTATRVNNFNNLASLPPGTLLGTPGAAGGSPTLYANGTGTAFNSIATAPVAITSTSFPANLFLLTVQVTAPGASGAPMVFSSLGLDTNNYNYLGDVLGSNPPRPIDALQNQIWFNIGSSLTAATLFAALFPTWIDPSASAPPWKASTAFAADQLVTDSNGNVEIVTTAGTSGSSVPGWNPTAGQTTTDGSVSWKNLGPLIPVATFTLGKAAGGTDGTDGAEPKSADYTTPFRYLAALEDIAIVATPGASIYDDHTNIMIGAVIPHVTAQRAYRVAILEAGPGLLDSDYENVRAQIDTSYAALYVPWVYTPNPLAVAGTSLPSQILVPPSGAMAGIYGRNDVEYSVAKAPANEVVLGAVDFERHINFAEQQLLNPLGINCLRYFPDRGFRVWGARTVSSDTSVMYINVRRYLIYLEHSIDNGTQWAVFQNNGPMLWARVRDSIESFLNNEFVEGNLLGSSPSQAYFVRCDRTTMTQNDLDQGRMICVIGVALLKPAEFVIFRIGQMTAGAQS